MSSDREMTPARRKQAEDLTPRTAVPLGIDDPVDSARAELKAALFAIEEKVNVPKQVERASVKVRLFARQEPVVAVAAAVGIALAVGGLVWGAAMAVAGPRR